MSATEANFVNAPGLPRVVVAIDGPAASGKSSVARLLARRLGYAYVNTGAMYRAVAWLAVQKAVDARDEEAVKAALYSANLVFEVEERDGMLESCIRLDGSDLAPYLSEAAVNAAVSLVASIPKVRQNLVFRQRAFVQQADLVMEGRDIGTNVFPETPLKFYIDASPEVRAQRRAAQGLQDDLATRDRIDSTRKASPLSIAPDALVIDSSHLTVEGVAGEILGRLKLKGLSAAL